MPPTNDNFADALLLPHPSGSLVFSNVDSTTETDESVRGDGHSVWFRYVARGDGNTLTVRTSGTPLPAWDSIVYVYTGTALTDLVVVAHDDDGDPQPGSTESYGTSKVVISPTVAGETYWIQVSAYEDLDPFERSDAVLTWAEAQPYNGPWLDQAPVDHHVHLAGSSADYAEQHLSVHRFDHNTNNPSESGYHHDTTLSFDKVAAGSDPIVDHGFSTGGGVINIGVIAARDDWDGELAYWQVSYARIAIRYDSSVNDHLDEWEAPPNPDPPDLGMDYEFPPGSGDPEVFGDPLTQLYVAAGVTGLHVTHTGLLANHRSFGGVMVHGLDASLEVRLAPGNPHTDAEPSGGVLAGYPDHMTEWLTPVELAALPLLASIPLPNAGEPTWLGGTGTDPLWADAPNFDIPLDPIEYDIPLDALPRRYADGFVGQSVEVIYCLNIQSSGEAPTIGPMAQPPNEAHDEFHPLYDYNDEWWQTSVTLPPWSIDLSEEGTLEHPTWDFDVTYTPPRYRYHFMRVLADLLSPTRMRQHTRPERMRQHTRPERMRQHGR